jgi:hypothetical protein
MKRVTGIGGWKPVRVVRKTPGDHTAAALPYGRTLKNRASISSLVEALAIARFAREPATLDSAANAPERAAAPTAAERAATPASRRAENCYAMSSVVIAKTEESSVG